MNAVVIGASGGLGAAFVRRLGADGSIARVYAMARRRSNQADARISDVPIDIEVEASIAEAAAAVARDGAPLHRVIVATGILHDGDGLAPEKTWAALDPEVLARAYRVNTIGPALVAKHFLPLLDRDRPSVFAALSARVGSISDNALGGWHAYRASKAALNMMIRNFAIELGRRNPKAACVGLHPGTVDTALSAPFQRGVPAGKLFAPDDAAARLLTVLDTLSPADSGRVFAWDGQEVPA